MIYMLINNNLATYKEIRDDYDIWEVLDLYEVCLTSIYNAIEANKGAMKNG